MQGTLVPKGLGALCWGGGTLGGGEKASITPSPLLALDRV